MVKTYIFRYMYKKGLGLSQILLSSVKVTINSKLQPQVQQAGERFI